jgi:hypothetical protein
MKMADVWLAGGYPLLGEKQQALLWLKQMG